MWVANRHSVTRASQASRSWTGTGWSESSERPRGMGREEKVSQPWPGVGTRWKGRSLGQGSDPEGPARSKNRCETEAVNVLGAVGSALEEMTPSKMHCHWCVFTGAGTQQLGLDSHGLEELTRAHKTLCLSKAARKGIHPSWAGRTASFSITHSFDKWTLCSLSDQDPRDSDLCKTQPFPQVVY